MPNQPLSPFLTTYATCASCLIRSPIPFCLCSFPPAMNAADDGCAYREPPPPHAHLDTRDPFVLVDHARCDPAAVHRDLMRRKQMTLAQVATSVDSMLSTRPKPHQQHHSSQPHETTSSGPSSSSSSSSSSHSVPTGTGTDTNASTQRQPLSNHQHQQPEGPTGMAWDLANSVRYLTEKRLNGEPVGALPALSVKDEERAKKRANEEWRIRRKIESEAKLAARVQADEETVRRKTEFTAASKFEQQQRCVFVCDISVYVDAWISACCLARCCSLTPRAHIMYPMFAYLRTVIFKLSCIYAPTHSHTRCAQIHEHHLRHSAQRIPRGDSRQRARPRRVLPNPDAGGFQLSSCACDQSSYHITSLPIIVLHQKCIITRFSSNDVSMLQKRQPM